MLRFSLNIEELPLSNWSIINGEAKTGITSMYMVKALDAGDMILKKECIIEYSDNAESLHDRLSLLGGEVLIETIKAIEDNNFVRISQNDSEVSLAPMLNNDNTIIDFSRKCIEVYNFIRGLNPYPSAYTFIGNKKIKIISSNETNVISNGNIGEYVKKDGKIFVQTADFMLEIIDVIPQGSKKMKFYDFFNGLRGKV
jgi:methionyl-tRNA formyltransferase